MAGEVISIFMHNHKNSKSNIFIVNEIIHEKYSIRCHLCNKVFFNKYKLKPHKTVLFQKLNTTRSNISSQERHELQNRNAMLPPSCMMMMQAEAEQRSTLSISTNDDEEDNMPKEAHVQATSVKNSSISTTRSSQGACLDRGLTAAAQHNTDARLSTLTLGKGLFLHSSFIS